MSTHYYVRRRPDPYQGRALEKLGHAIEYLVDSRMAWNDRRTTRADAEAVDMLMGLSRCVFSECEEILPVSQRIKGWMMRTVSRRAH
jgi:hypothetical protein